MKTSNILSVLFAGVFGWLLGLVLGVLGWREYERVKQDQAFNRVAAEQSIGGGAIIQAGSDVRPRQTGPEIITCDLCGEDNKLYPGDPMLCDNCGQELHPDHE